MNASDTNECPSRQEWQAFARGQLPEAQAVYALAHLQRCPRCSTVLQQDGPRSAALIAELCRPPHEPMSPDVEVERRAMLIGALMKSFASTSGTAPKPLDLPASPTVLGSTDSERSRPIAR